MKTTLLLLGLVSALVPLSTHAQGTCGSASNVFDFTAAANDDVDWRTRSATVGQTTFSTSGFASSNNVATFRTEDLTTNNQRLVWKADYAAINGTSTVTFTFSRAVSSLKIVVSDIDRNGQSGNRNNYQDAVTFDAYPTDEVSVANRIGLTNDNVVNSRTGLTRNGNTITDATNVNDGDGITTITFAQPVKKLVLTYANTATADNNPGSQSIGINSLTWCKLTPTAANDAQTTSYYTPPAVNVLSNDVADGTFNAATLDLIPATPAVDAVFTDANGVTYTANPTTGLVTITNSAKYVGTSVLAYSVKDNAAQVATASLTTTLTNAAPVASNYSVTRSYSVSTPINLLAGVTDEDDNASIDEATVDLNPALSRRQATYAVPNQGVFTVDDAGAVTFAPVNNFVGTSTLSYTVQDEKGLLAGVKQLVLTTTSAAPVATNDVATRSNIAREPIYILLNDTDPDNDLAPATVDLNPATPARDLTYTDGTKGTYTVDTNGLVSFAAQNGFTGTSTLTYRVQDARGSVSNTATLTLTVTQTLANDDSNVTPRNTVVLGNVLINDNNRPGTSLTVTTTPVTAPTHGRVTLQANGNYSYQPTTSYTGPDTFTYRVSDGNVSSTATVTMLVYDPTSACTEATGPNLLRNADFAQGNVGFQTDYTYVADQADVNNELVPEGLYAVGASAANFHGNFAQTGADGATDNFLMINGSNTIKKLYSQTVTVEPNKYYNFSAQVNNILAGVTQTTDDDPVFGFVINGASTSAITSIPENPDTWQVLSDIWFSGNNTTATFEIVNVSIAAGGNDMGIDNVYFGTCNEAPTAIRDLVFVPPIVATSFTVITNDQDDGGIQGTSVLLYPMAGTGTGSKNLTTSEGTFVTNVSTGAVTFTPAAGFTGSATIMYQGQDGAGAISNQAPVTVRVGPIAAADAQNMSGQRTAVLNATANDQDADGVNPATLDLDPSTPEQDLTRVVPNAGVFQADETGVVTFTPVSTFSGTVSIPYTVADYLGATSNQSRLSVTLNQPLPVTLTSFAVTTQGADALLNWVTATEVRNSHFVVERSLDGQAFAPIATVQGHGSTTQAHTYRFRDARAQQVAERLYYRLRQVDTDGTAQNSGVRTVKFEQPTGQPTFSVSPNPAVGPVTLDLTSLPTGPYTVQLLDATGRVLYTGSVVGGTTAPLAVRALSQGVYLVVVQSSRLRITQRLVQH